MFNPWLSGQVACGLAFRPRVKLSEFSATSLASECSRQGRLVVTLTAVSRVTERLEYRLSTTKKVAVAVVESAGKVLVGIRPQGAPLAGMHEFPGGKCESDETPRSCAVRECREETGLMVVPRDHLLTTTHEYDHGKVELHFWRCGLSPDLPDCVPATPPFRWVNIGELSQLNFPEGNQEVLSILGQYVGLT